MTDPILYLSMLLGLGGVYVLISSFHDDDDGDDDGEKYIYMLMMIPWSAQSSKEAFRHDNYQICSASNGEDALALPPKISPILVLLDLRMPVINGFQFLEHIKKWLFLFR